MDSSMGAMDLGIGTEVPRLALMDLGMGTTISILGLDGPKLEREGFVHRY